MAVKTLEVKSNFSEKTGNRPSPAIWAPFRSQLIGSVPGKFGKDIYFPPEKTTIPAFASGVSQFGWTTFQSTSVLIRGNPNEPGVIRFSTMDAANKAGVLTGDGNVGASVQLSTTSKASVLFEVAVKKSVIANNGVSFFAGLTAPGMAAGATTLLADTTHELADVNAIGFQVLAADGDTVNFVYRASGQALQTPIAGLVDMEAGEWVNLGFIYDPYAPSENRLKVFANNIEHVTKVTGADVALATFPKDVGLTATVAAKVGSAGTSGVFDLGFLRLGYSNA